MSNARFIVMFLLALALAAFAAQFVIDFSSVNIAASCIVLASSMTVLLYILWTPAIHTHPLSTFSLFGFCVTTQLGALLAQSACATSLAGNLRIPIETYATLACYQAIALVAHGVYRLLSGSRHGERPALLRDALQKLGLYATPSAGTLWIMGFVGLFAFLVSGGGSGVVSKALQGMIFVAWAPFLIPMYVIQNGPGYCRVGRHYGFLAVYAATIMMLGIAANARGFMLSGLMTIGLFSLLVAMRSEQKVNFGQIARLGALGVVLAALSIPLSDLITAMGVVRGSRGVSAVKMVEETLHYLQQPELLRAQRARDTLVSIQSSYDETYFASSLVGRLVETKFHDNALYFSTRLTARDEDKLVDVTVDFFWATLPDPMLKAMKIDVDKQELGFSMGDYYSYLVGAGGLGGYRTGSAFAQGQSVFGLFFPIVYLLFCPIIFWSQDLFASRTTRTGVLVSAVGMLGIWKLFQYGLTAESIQAIFITVVRGLPQVIVLYLLIFHVSRLGARALGQLVSAPRAAATLTA